MQDFKPFKHYRPLEERPFNMKVAPGIVNRLIQRACEVQKQKDKRSTYKKMNKLYKEVDFSKQFIASTDAKEVLKDENTQFYGLDALHKRGLIRKYAPNDASRFSYVYLEDLEQEMLRRELCCYQEEVINTRKWMIDNRSRIKKYRKKFDTEEEDIVVRFEGRELKLGTYKRCKTRKVNKAVKIFTKYLYLFRKENDPHISDFYAYELFKLLYTKGEDKMEIWKWIAKRKDKGIKG